jgi:hypothetical protein
MGEIHDFVINRNFVQLVSVNLNDDHLENTGSLVYRLTLLYFLLKKIKEPLKQILEWNIDHLSSIWTVKYKEIKSEMKLNKVLNTWAAKVNTTIGLYKSNA